MKSLLSLTVITLLAFAALSVASNAEDSTDQQTAFSGQVLFVSAGGKKHPLENVRFGEVQGRMMLIGDEIDIVSSGYGHVPDEYYPTGITVTIAWDKVVYYASKNAEAYKERFASQHDYIKRYDPERLNN